MAYNPYASHSPEVQSFLGSRMPVNYNWSSAGDPVVNRMNAVLNYEQNRAAQMKDIEWANQQRMSDPAYWAKAFGMNSGNASVDMSNFNVEQSPAYKWRYDQGLEALNRTAAAKRMLGSGNRLAELVNYGQGMASQEYDNEFNRRLAQQKLANDMRAQNMSMAMQGMNAMKRYMPPGQFTTPGGLVTRWD